ncbi:FAD-dependent oxidoreductase [Candidatus Pelagibacter ubique]|nr:FAD-dependent oxidoreductase [Candidatus Pelagibacter ubique]
MSAENISYDLKRFAGIKRDYTPEEVERLRGSIKIEYSMCKHQSKKLWHLLNSENYINTLGSLSGNHAIQHAKAGLKAIYLSGWQVAADANTAGEMYPDQSLYPYDSAPKLVESMNNALIRADQIQHMELQDGEMKSKDRTDYMLPIIADGEAGFGGPLNVFELAKKFIKAGAAGVHFEDQLASEKKCGHMGGKVLVPTGTMIKNLKTNKIEEMKIDGLFIAIGHDPATALFKEQLEMDKEGYLLTKPDSTETNIPGVYAAGDVKDKTFRQAVTAAGMGCMAALEAEKFLSH